MTPDLTDYDVILINTSGGKDSQTMMRRVYDLACRAGVTDRLFAVHADLGRVEWEGVPELAKAQAFHYGIPFRVVKRPQGDPVRGTRLAGDLPKAEAEEFIEQLKAAQRADGHREHEDYIAFGDIPGVPEASDDHVSSD